MAVFSTSCFLFVKYFLVDIKQLTKFKLSISVLFSAVAGYFLVADTINFRTLLLLVFGGYFTVGASNAFNQIIEKDLDKKMPRTQNRPLPTGRMSVFMAFFIAVFLTLTGLYLLYLINFITALLAGVSIFIYTLIYTPLKTITPLSVFVGAFPGAIPFMLGWVAHTNQIGIEVTSLFLIQFFWQFPHFWSIAWIEEVAYKNAGFKMLPMGKKNKATVHQIILYTVVMLLVSVAPVLKKMGGFYITPFTAVLVFLLGVFVLYRAVAMLKDTSIKAGKKLMLASVFYITAVQIVYVLDKILR